MDWWKLILSFTVLVTFHLQRDWGVTRNFHYSTALPQNNYVYIQFISCAKYFFGGGQKRLKTCWWPLQFQRHVLISYSYVSYIASHITWSTECCWIYLVSIQLKFKWEMIHKDFIIVIVISQGPTTFWLWQGVTRGGYSYPGVVVYIWPNTCDIIL